MYFECWTCSELSTEIELGVDTGEDIGFNESVESQELDYEDTVQDEVEYTGEGEGEYGGEGEGGYEGQEGEDPLVVDGQPNPSAVMFSSSEVSTLSWG